MKRNHRIIIIAGLLAGAWIGLAQELKEPGVTPGQPPVEVTDRVPAGFLQLHYTERQNLAREDEAGLVPVLLLTRQEDLSRGEREYLRAWANVNRGHADAEAAWLHTGYAASSPAAYYYERARWGGQQEVEACLAANVADPTRHLTHVGRAVQMLTARLGLDPAPYYEALLGQGVSCPVYLDWFKGHVAAAEDPIAVLAAELRALIPRPASDARTAAIREIRGMLILYREVEDD